MLQEIFRPYRGFVLARYETFMRQQKQDEAARQRESTPYTIGGSRDVGFGLVIKTSTRTITPEPTTPLRMADERIKKWPFGSSIVERHNRNTCLPN